MKGAALRRRRGRFGWIAALVAASVLAGCGGATREGASDTVFEDDFSDSRSGWPVADDDFVLLEYADDGYRVVLRDPSRPHASWLFQVAEGEPALTVEADATLRADPEGPRVSWGVACSSIERGPGEAERRPGEVSYFFQISSDGLWAIGREDSESVDEEFIARGEGGVEGPGEPHRLKAECVAHGDGRATVAFAVDGNEVARTTDPDGPSGFSAVALHMRAEASNMEVFFDDVFVRRGEAP